MARAERLSSAIVPLRIGRGGKTSTKPDGRSHAGVAGKRGIPHQTAQSSPSRSPVLGSIMGPELGILRYASVE